MNVTGKQLITVAVLAVLVAIGWAAKLVWYPAVDEKFFLLDYQRLERAPAHVLILRPTEFSSSRRSGGFAAPTRLKNGQYDNKQMRAVGRNTTLANVIGTAYQYSQWRVIVPPDAVTNRYDFLDTATSHPLEQFRALIKSKLGYTASVQSRNVPVLVLKAQGSGPTPSTADRENFNFNAGKLTVTHISIQQLANMTQDSLKQPVVDETGLTGFYDLTIPWRGGNLPDVQAANNLLNPVGLALLSDTRTLPMMVVEAAK
jgi:uncharacterized protein (TIGR03435 family)